MQSMRLNSNARLGSTLAAVALTVISFCGLAPAQTTKPDYYPATSDGLTQYFKDMLICSDKNDQQHLLLMCQALVLPKPLEWFSDVFGKQTGAKLAADYEKEMKGFGPSLAKLFLNLNDPKTLQIVITRVETPEDSQVKLLQVYALNAMQKPVTLYSVLIKREGTATTLGLWSLVYVDNNFRLAGKMLILQDIARGKK